MRAITQDVYGLADVLSLQGRLRRPRHGDKDLADQGSLHLVHSRRLGASMRGSRSGIRLFFGGLRDRSFRTLGCLMSPGTRRGHSAKGSGRFSGGDAVFGDSLGVPAWAPLPKYARGHEDRPDAQARHGSLSRRRHRGLLRFGSPAGLRDQGPAQADSQCWILGGRRPERAVGLVAVQIAKAFGAEGSPAPAAPTKMGHWCAPSALTTLIDWPARDFQRRATTVMT